MKKTKLTHSRWARAVAFVLFVAAFALTCMCALGVILGVEEGWYEEDEDFSYYDSWYFCKKLVYNRLGILDDYLRYEYPGDMGYLEKDSNFLFRVSDRNGNTVSQNCDGEQAVLVTTSVYYINSGSNSEFGVPAGEYTIEAYLKYPISSDDEFLAYRMKFESLFTRRWEILWTGLAFLAVSLGLMAFLLCSAGHRKGVEGPVPLGQDKIPLDIYAVIVVALIGVLAAIAEEIYYMDDMLYQLLWGGVLVILPGSAVLMAALMTIASRLKMGRFWRNTVIYRVLSVLWRYIRRLAGLVWEIVGRIPMLGKAALAVLLMAAVNLLLGALTIAEDSALALALLILIDAMALLGVFLLLIQTLRLKDGGEALARGDLEYKVDTSGMLWEIKRHGENLNSISTGMVRAVEERMRSEHFKTELITNVSHDIKTPLTSMINYIDLLKKEELPGEKAREYLEVLDRQSARLKKLTEDLVEASKASSGAMKTELTRLNVGELLTQSVGEYEERLEKAGLSLVMSVGEAGGIIADGRLLWRVFDNLLSNICKYSQSGTRVYVTAVKEACEVRITFRNISRDVLDVSADALMERFVRGDSSRSSEGSGLGLSIARSLTELMGGSFDISVDGDLFKAQVVFGAM